MSETRVSLGDQVRLRDSIVADRDVYVSQAVMAPPVAHRIHVISAPADRPIVLRAVQKLRQDGFVDVSFERPTVRDGLSVEEQHAIASADEVQVCWSPRARRDPYVEAALDFARQLKALRVVDAELLGNIPEPNRGIRESGSASRLLRTTRPAHRSPAGPGRVCLRAWRRLLEDDFEECRLVGVVAQLRGVHPSGFVAPRSLNERQLVCSERCLCRTSSHHVAASFSSTEPPRLRAVAISRGAPCQPGFVGLLLALSKRRVCQRQVVGTWFRPATSTSRLHLRTLRERLTLLMRLSTETGGLWMPPHDQTQP